MLRWLLIFLALSFHAAAQTIGDEGAGYTYPETGGSATFCSPVCTAASVTWQVPVSPTYDGVGSQGQIFQWIGISGSTTAGNSCPGSSCLGQFGTYTIVSSGGSVSNAAFWELFCTNSPSAPCNNVQTIGGFTVNSGDIVTATMTCMASCTADSASQKWAVSLIDHTSGSTWTNSGTQFTWPLGLGQVYYALELVSAGAPNFGTVAYSNLSVTQNGVAGPPAWALLKYSANYARQGSGANRQWGWPSPPIGPNGDGFSVCYSKGTSTPAGCPGGAYSGVAGALGP